MCSYTLYTLLSPCQLSHLLTSQACFPARLPTASPAKRKAGSFFGQLKRTEIKHHFQRSRGHARLLIFFFALLACKPLSRTHLGEKCLRSEACRSETSAHTGWMSKEPSHDCCSIQCSAPESEPCQHLWVVQHWLELQSRNMSVPDISLLCSFSSRQRFKFLVCVEGLLEGPLIPLSICGLCRLDVGFQMAA